MAEAVVTRALVAVGEHRVGLGRFLEAVFRRGVAGVSIRMVLLRELPVGGLDRLVVRVAGDAQDVVVVAFGCRRHMRIISPRRRHRRSFGAIDR